MKFLHRITQISLVTILFLNCVGAIGTSFLTVPSYPREVALGGVVPSIQGDPSLYQGNPALIGTPGSISHIFLGYNRWLANTKGFSLLVTNPAFRGTFGLGIRQLGLFDLEYRTSTPTDELLSHFAASGTAIEAIWGKRFNRLIWGLSFRWIRIETHIYTSTGFSSDMGISWSSVNNQITMGISLLNVGSMSRFKRDSPQLPTMFLLGLTVKTYPWSQIGKTRFHSFTTLVTEYSKFHGWVGRVSGELFYQGIRFTLGTRLSKRVVGLGMGVGLNWRRFQLNYGLEIASHQIGIPHLFQFDITLP